MIQLFQGRVRVPGKNQLASLCVESAQACELVGRKHAHAGQDENIAGEAGKRSRRHNLKLQVLAQQQQQNAAVMIEKLRIEVPGGIRKIDSEIANRSPAGIESVLVLLDPRKDLLSRGEV